MRDTKSDISFFFFFLSRINWKNDWKLLYRSFFFPYKKILFFLSKYRITGCVNRIVRKEYYIWYLTADNDEGHCTRTETAHQRFLLFIRDNTTGGRTVRHLQGTKSSSNWLFFFFQQGDNLLNYDAEFHFIHGYFTESQSFRSLPSPSSYKIT